MAVIDATPVMSADTKQAFEDWIYMAVTDNLNDTQQHVATTKAKGTKSKGILVIKCQEVGGRPYAVYAPGEYVGESDERRVKYRVDKNKRITEKWLASGKKFINFDTALVKIFAKKLMAGSTFIIQSYRYDFSPVRHNFSLKGSTAAISRVLKKCAK